jgi:sugar-specific transcriptional regulator TrmB
MKTLPVVTRNFQRIVEIKSKRNLTTVANRIQAVIQANEEEYEIAHQMYAPSECYRDIQRGLDATLEQIIVEEGFINADILLEVLKRRTSPKFVYFSCFQHLYSLTTGN